MSRPPRLTIGLPVFNGERFLAESLDALLGQTFKDFELVISDNASTDGTEEICRGYMAADERIRYVRQRSNIGGTPNHNLVVQLARGELFKWASHDDLYGRELLERCIEALDADPGIVVSHAWQAIVDDHGKVIHAVDYGLATSSPRAPERFRSLLFAPGGDDFYGVMRTELIRRFPLGDFHHSDRTIVAELALQGRFHQVPELLFFRRDHVERAERAHPTPRQRCVNMNPRRADRLRHPTVRLMGEYVYAFIAAIAHAPIPPADRRECYRALARYFVSRTRSSGSATPDPVPHGRLEELSEAVDSVVAGRGGRS